MRMRLIPGFGLFLALVGILPARAAEATVESANSTLVVRIKSINGLLEDLKYVAKLGGKGDEADMASGYVNGLSSDKGLEGIDPKKPIGLFGNVAEDPTSSKPVLMVPVIDSKSVLGLLEKLNVKLDKGENDIYEASNPYVPAAVRVFLRFANGYAYVTLNSKALLADDKLADPTKFFGELGSATVSFSFRIDQVPESLKQLFLGQMEMHIAEDQDKDKDHETPAQKHLRVETAKLAGEKIATIIKDGGRLNMSFNVDREGQKLVAQLDLAGIDNSVLKTDLAELGNLASRFGAWHESGDALDLLLHLSLPAKLHDAFAAVMKEQIKKDLAKEENQTKREHAEKLIKAADASIKAGEMDLGLRMIGPDKDSHYTIVGGLKLRDGKKIEEAVKEVISQLPQEKRKDVTLDAEKIGDVSVTRLNVEQKLDRHAKATLGENPIYVAIADDGAFFAAGPDAKKALGNALESKPKASALLELDVQIAKLAPAMASHHSDQEAAAIKKAMSECFKGEGGDGLHLSIKGGDAFTLLFSVESAAVRFISEIEHNVKHGHRARPQNFKHKKEKHGDDGDSSDDSDSDD
jgi:hypothetical protein